MVELLFALVLILAIAVAVLAYALWLQGRMRRLERAKHLYWKEMYFKIIYKGEF